ncbi:11164_t:CDS:2 [Entrophospora sp. SA101]|nr:11164_t:CDS:2 [Entrophospora sp. SA101]
MPRRLRRNQTDTIANNNDDYDDSDGYDIALEIRHQKILKYKAEIAKMEAKPISSVIYQNQRANITEFQNCITIGHEKSCNIIINKPLYIARLHCKILIRKTNNKGLGYESFIKNSSNKRTFINEKLLEPSEEHVLHHNDKILVKAHVGFIVTTSYDKNYYNHCINVRHSKILIAKMGAKAISSVVFEGNKVILSEAQKQITIGRDLAANLTISHPFVASIQCILTIRKTDKIHYVRELNFETVLKNGWNTRTHLNGIQLKWNEEQVLNHNDLISIKVEGGFFYVQFFEDAKTDYENIIAEENNRLPAQSGERYHVINNEDDSNDHDKTGKTCIIKKVRSNNCNDEKIYAAKIIHVSDAKYDKNRIIEYRNEIDILKILDHENIIKVVDDYFDEENIVIILPYLCGGSLEDYIKTLNDSQSNTSLIVRRMSNLNSEVIQEDVEMEDVDELVETPIKNSPNLSSKKRVSDSTEKSSIKEREALQESIQGNLPEHEAQKKINNEVRDQLPKEISKPTI